MKVFRQLDDFENPNRRGIFCAIGMFDGLHLGHQRVIDRTVKQARQAKGLSLAVTFDQHPARVVAPERTPAWIYPFRQRQFFLEKIQLDLLWIIPFDRHFSQISGNAFLELLCRQFHPLKLICVGPDFHFGHRRSGNIQLLRDRAASFGYELPPIAPVRQQGKEISSTAIRSLIAEGHLEEAGKCLGRQYAICGQVVRGRKTGRQLGFPTANLDTSGLALPPNGVYPALTKVQDQTFQGVANIGCRPTIESSGPAPTVEVHLFHFDRNLYGEHLEVQPLKRIRPEQKFPTLQALRNQIKRDTETAAQFFEKPPTPNPRFCAAAKF